MTRQLAMLFASAALLSGVTAVFAGRTSEAMVPQTPTAAQSKHEGHGAMMGHMGNMSPEQMQKMMESCSRMMEKATKAPAEPTK